MLLVFVQAAADGGSKLDLIAYIPWFLAGLTTVIGSLAAALGVTYRGQVRALESENKRKDELIDRLIQQLSRATDVQDRAVSYVERGPHR